MLPNVQRAVFMKRTPRDDEILSALACKIRLFSLDQIARAWWKSSTSPVNLARRRLNQLDAAGFIERRRVTAGPMIHLDAPVATWSPGEPDPEAGSIAWRLQSRWPKVAAPGVTVYRSTVTTHKQYGGPPRAKPIRSGTETHDLHLSALYLMFCESRPEDAEAWLGEDLQPPAGFAMKDPDAFIQRNGSELVIEFGGKYDARHIEEFHSDCRRRERPYELW
jgi:hypothetical protein